MKTARELLHELGRVWFLADMGVKMQMIEARDAEWQSYVDAARAEALREAANLAGKTFVVIGNARYQLTAVAEEIEALIDEAGK